MADYPNYLDPRTLASLEGLELRARSIVEGFVSGKHRSPHRGFSVEFAEHREYAPGDDLRRLDWKVFGRTDKLYLKQYEEETNLACHLVVDTSESMAYRGPDAALSKLDYGRCLAAALAHLVLRQQDAVGAVTFDHQIRALLRPSNNPAHLKAVIQTLEQAGHADDSGIGDVLADVAERLNKRSLVVVISDLFDDESAILRGLERLRHRRHDVIVMHTLDRAELDFPFRDIARFRDLESSGAVVADPRVLRRAYQDEINQFLQRIGTGCRSRHVDYAQMTTDAPLDLALSAFLARRLGRVA
ncbi:MAG: DUF58 domain-containing protein [Pirellulales bacterium]